MLATPVVLWAGWPFFVRGWALGRHAQSQHVHPDRDGHGRGLGLQRRGDASRPALPAGLPRPQDGAVPVYFEAAAVITVLVLLGPGARAAGARADRRRDPRACSISRPRRRAASVPTATEEDVPLEVVAGRRPTARAPRREGAGRRRIVEGRERRRRVDGHRRVDAGRPRRPASGSSAAPINQTGSLRHARRAGRRATRCWRRSSRWWPRPSAAARRSSASPIRCRAGSCRRHRGRRARVRRLGGLRPRAALRLRPRRRGGGAHHRLPLRAGARDARCRSWSASGAARRPAC